MKFKKTILITALIAIVAILVFVLVNSTSDTIDNSDANNVEASANEQPRMINIRENMFLTQVEDVHRNMNRYRGRPVNLEGAIIIIPMGDDESFHAVGRSAPRLLWR